MNPQIKDNFLDLLIKEPTREHFKSFIKNNVGELNTLDFKESWIFGSHLAKTVLALANTKGGLIAFGINENEDNTISVKGLERLEDKGKINDSISKYLPETLDYQIYDISYNENDGTEFAGKKFQLFIVNYTPSRLPFICRKTGEDRVEAGAVYVRKGTKCEKATAYDIDQMIEQRIASIYKASGEMTLEQHLAQLKVLYNEMPKTVKVLVKKGTASTFALTMRSIADLFSSTDGMGDVYEERSNPFYPEEDYEQFISRMITKKKVRIENELGVK